MKTKQDREGVKDIREEVIDWLRDAYAMERGLEGSLEKQSKNQDLNPALRERVAMHLEETRRHAHQMESALKSLGTDTSALKTGMGVLGQSVKGFATKFARDEEIKDLLDAYAMEHFEIACYTALAAAATQAGLAQIAEICRGIISEEERMATWIKEFLPDRISFYLVGSERISSV
jgi:ferritin-like metal-binding protein YciE